LGSGKELQETSNVAETHANVSLHLELRKRITKGVMGKEEDRHGNSG